MATDDKEPKTALEQETPTERMRQGESRGHMIWVLGFAFLLAAVGLAWVFFNFAVGPDVAP